MRSYSKGASVLGFKECCGAPRAPSTSGQAQSTRGAAHEINRTRDVYLRAHSRVLKSAGAVVFCLVFAACKTAQLHPAGPWRALSWTAGVDDHRRSGRCVWRTTRTGASRSTFPVDEGWMKYEYTRRPPQAIGGAVMVSIQVITTGEVLFNPLREPSNTCRTPATVRPFIWAHSNGLGEGDRWWSSGPAYQLARGSATLTIQLTPDQWAAGGGGGGAGSPPLSAFTAALWGVRRPRGGGGGGVLLPGHGINARGRRDSSSGLPDPGSLPSRTRPRLLDLSRDCSRSVAGPAPAANGPKLRIQLWSARSRQTFSVMRRPPGDSSMACDGCHSRDRT